MAPQVTLRLATIIALCCSGLPATSVADAPQERPLPTATAQAIHAEGDYPDSLSLAPEPEEPPDWLRDLADAIGAFFEAVGPFLKVLLYGLLVVAVLYLVARLVNHLAEPGETSEDAQPTTVVRSQRVDELPIPPDDPDALAAQGQFDRAIYVLLLRALRQVGWGGAPGDASLTAREVAGGVAETDRRQSPLRQLVALSEPVRFGGVAAGAQTYGEARRHYLALCEGA